MAHKCWCEGYCKLYGTDKCGEDCDVFVIMKALYSVSNIPKIYQFEKAIKPSEKDLEAFRFLKEYKDNILTNIEMGQGLYLWSNGTGNGKTSWATKILNHYYRKAVFTTGLEHEGYFITVPTFLEELRKSYNTGDTDFESKMDNVLNSKILIMDDIGSEKCSEWVAERIFTIINERINKGLVTIYTSNISPEELSVRLGNRIYSRIKGSSHIIQLFGQDRRVV